MSRSKYVSVGDTGGLILDSKYDDFVTNAQLESKLGGIENRLVALEQKLTDGSQKVQLSGQDGALEVTLTGSNEEPVNVEVSGPVNLVRGGALHTPLVVEPITAAKRPYPPRITPEIIQSNRRISWLSSDGKVLFSGASPYLRRSLDEGETWNIVHTFPYTVYMVRDLADGELLVCIYDPTDHSEKASLWKSRGWDPEDFSGTTWEKVQDLYHARVYVENNWGISTYDNVIVIAEYGPKTAEYNARHVYLSTDYGETWETIFDLGSTEGAHLHGVCFDPWYNRIWVSNGDGPHTAIRYSDDWGKTWTVVSNKQVTSIIALEHAVVFATDSSTNGFLRAPRIGRGKTPIIEEIHVETPDSLKLVGQLIYKRPGPEFPAFFSFSRPEYSGPALVYASMDGLTFHEVWRDWQDYQLRGMLAFVGPTEGGKVIGTLLDNRHTTSLVIADAPQWV